MVETSTRQNLKDRPLRLADRAAAGEGQEYSFSISCKVIGTFFYTLTSTRRLSPSDGDSLGSDQSSGRESAEENQLQEPLYSNRGQYEDPPSSSRPRPVGGSTGAQLHHLTQVGLSSQIRAYPGVERVYVIISGGRSVLCITKYGGSLKKMYQSTFVLSFPEFSSSSVFQMPSSSLRDSSAPPLLLTSPTPEYLPEDASPSAHTSASLIKAIREELRRLAQKQAAVTTYH
uniref:Uncharacterized protein n=1 Tax=Cynoglossus semilaevis TaxID=244447 RepID=A0A3P8UUR5_CYNSE